MDVNKWQYVEPKSKQSQSLKNQCGTDCCSGGNKHPYITFSLLVLTKCLLMFGLCAAVVSIPWEFIRLYQKAVAERASTIVQGAPPECSPDNLTLFERIKSLLVSQFSWTHTRSPCQDYYYALLVDPLWEVTPAMVLISVFTRCCLHPLKLISNSLGRSLQVFFSEIPFQWQPFFMLVASVIVFVLLLMLFGYRLSIPLILRLEPRSPLCRQTYTRNNSYQDNIVRKTDSNIHCDERRHSPFHEDVLERTPVRSLSRTINETMINQNHCRLDFKPDKDCRRVNNKEDLCNNLIQCSAGNALGGSVAKKQNVSDRWKLPVSELPTSKTEKTKPQTLYQSKSMVATNFIEIGKSTVPLKSRKRNVTKRKSKLNSLWTPGSDDYVSSDSE